MNIKIEKGVPAPSGRTVGMTAVLRSMQPGDSFALPTDVSSNVLRVTANRVPGKFIVRKTPDGYRCWRIE